MTDTNNTDGAALLPVTPGLLPCPFCGSPEPGLITPMLGDGWWVRCYGCGCETDLFAEEDQALTAWNTRISHSIPGGVGMLNEKERDHLAGEILGDQMSDEELQSWADARLTTISVGKAIKAVRAALERAALTPSAPTSDATKRMEQTLGAKFALTPDRIGKDAVREAEAWLRAISDWLLANDHDMTLPSGILDTDPLDIADSLAALAHPAQATPSAVSGDAGERE